MAGFEQDITALINRMTLEEKAGLMFHAMIEVGSDGHLADSRSFFGDTREMVSDKLLNHFNILEVPEPELLAHWHNELQQLARQTRLGIPVTISSDPRHSFSQNLGADFLAGHFSRWPQPIGFGAIGDADVVYEFAQMAREEYLAVGIRVALHPMADLATEPRWSRTYGTFGEDAQTVSRLVAAYIRGFQGDTVGTQSVACMTKHFPGGGPQKDGEDPHFAIGKEQIYPGRKFEHHLLPFEAAFAAGTSQIMPYYGMPVDTEYEEVGFAFSRRIITELLRERYGFDGIVCTDWRLLTPLTIGGVEVIEAKCWGLEDKSPHERARLALEAGCDQFGGETCPEIIVDLVRDGAISEARLDQSVRRLLREKFRLGLFADPLVDVSRARESVGRAEYVAAGKKAQRDSIVVLKNGVDAPCLPLAGGVRLYLQGVDADVASRYAQVVESPEEADFAIVRTATPHEPREGLLESRFHSGDIDFKGEARDHLLGLLQRVPTIVDIYLDRPAVIPEVAAAAHALIGNFGAEDDALLDIVFGRHAPRGRLPFEMPSSMDAVRANHPDVPFDSSSPLYPFGFGLTF